MKKDTVASIRFKKEDMALVREAARRYGWTTSEFIRWAALQRVGPTGTFPSLGYTTNSAATLTISP